MESNEIVISLRCFLWCNFVWIALFSSVFFWSLSVRNENDRVVKKLKAFEKTLKELKGILK